MGNFVVYGIFVSVFLGISWIMRILLSQDVSRRVDRKIAEDEAGLCTWPREFAGE
jgi:hypothetical protein